MKSPLKSLIIVAATLVPLALVAYYATSRGVTKTQKEANRFYAVASQTTHLLDAIREAPDFHGIYFGTCAQIARPDNAGEEYPFVFIPKVGERVKFKTVKDALDKNVAMLRDYEACRKTSVVFMETFPYRGVVGLDLDGRGYVVKAYEPTFSN